MELMRLNLDSSWYISMNGASFIMDPWLIGSEVDGFRWLNEQWHVRDPVALDDLPEHQFIVITQSYEDHCHLDTLSRMDPKTPILATAKAYRRLKAKFANREILLIPHGTGQLKWHGLSFQGYRPKRMLDPIYFAISVESEVSGESIFYAPHGFTLSVSQLARLGRKTTSLLITTFTDFRIPEILGGHVNPGLDNAMLLHRQINPSNVINTHDEQKRMKGLVARTAKVEYPDYAALSSRSDMKFIDVQDYRRFEV